MTAAQHDAYRKLCDRYGVTPTPEALELNPFDLPAGYVAGWVGPIYVGISPTGEVSS